ncbi:MAG: PmoA family protein [Planctomycetes bacterium]|nr:PmoA family protein [Planctomycetota bacterium]
MRRPALVLLALLASRIAAQDAPLRFVLELAAPRAAGPIDVVLPITSASAPAGSPALARLDDDTLVRADVIARADSGDATLRLRWVARTAMDAGAHALALHWLPHDAAPCPFAWAGPADARTLTLHDRAVWTFAARFDLEDFDATYKPFHELWSPDGATLLTKGLGGTHPHHRGLFVGWNQTNSGDATHDFWHCREGRHQRRVDGAESPFPVVADERSSIEWRDADGRAVVRETRTLSAWDAGDDRHVLDLVVELSGASDRPVALRGDAQHAGCHIRLAHEVEEHQAATRYERPEGAKAAGDDVWRDCAWALVRAQVGDVDAVLLHVTAPRAGAPFVYSTRAYGRVGSFQTLDLEPGASVVLRYRFVVTTKTVTLDPARIAADFVAPLRVSPAAH